MNLMNLMNIVNKLNVFGKGIVEKGVAYPLICANGHFLAVIGDEKFIIDTGSAATFRFSLLEGRTGVAAALINLLRFGNFRDDACELVGCEVDGLIGTDVMGDAGNVLFDFENNTVTFGADTPLADTDCYFSVHPAGAIVTLQEVGGKKVNTILDTGAKINYINKSDLPDGAEFVRKDRDFNPQLGWYDVDVYRLPVVLLGKSRTMEFATMTAGVRSLVGIFGARMVIGINDLSDKYVFIDFENGRVIAP